MKVIKKKVLKRWNWNNGTRIKVLKWKYQKGTKVEMP